MLYHVEISLIPGRIDTTAAHPPLGSIEEGHRSFLNPASRVLTYRRYLLRESPVNGSVPAISEAQSGHFGRHFSFNYLTLSRLRNHACHALHICVIGQLHYYSEVIISSCCNNQLLYPARSLVTRLVRLDHCRHAPMLLATPPLLVFPVTIYRTRLGHLA